MLCSASHALSRYLRLSAKRLPPGRGSLEQLVVGTGLEHFGLFIIEVVLPVLKKTEKSHCNCCSSL